MCRLKQKIAAVALGTLLVAALVSLPATVATAVTKNWNVVGGTALWSTGSNWSPAGAPGANDAVNIVFTNGVARTVSYDVAAPSLGLLSIDLTGNPVANTSTLLLPNNINLTTNGIIVGGYNGVGATGGKSALTQSGGTTTTGAVDLIVGWGSGSTGVYTLSGGALVNNLHEYIGLDGKGTFNHSGGSNTINASGTGFFSVGHSATSTGTYNLSGTGTLISNANEYVGYSGTGIFNQTGGTHTITSGLSLGVDPLANGSYALSGTGSLTINGYENIGLQGTGAFTQTAGAHTVAAELNLGWNVNSAGSYFLSGSGSSLTVNGDEYIGRFGEGDFTQNGGTHTVGGAGAVANRDLYLGYGDATSSYSLSGSGSTLTVNGNEYIGTNGAGNFTQNGGTHAVSGDLAFGISSLGGGVYALSGGALTVGGLESIGLNSTGNFFTQTGGTHTVGSGAPFGALVLGRSSGDSGTYSLSGSGVLAVTGDTYVGGSPTAAGGTGVMNLSGGSATMTGTMKVWNTPGTAVNLAGATLTVGSLDTDGNASHFNWISGALNLTNSSLTIGSTGPLGTSPTIDSAKALTVTGTTTIDPLRTLTLSGSSFSTGNLVNNGTFNFVSGSLAITGAGGLTIGTGGGLGTTLIAGSGQNYNITNDTTVASNGQLVIGDGNFNAAGGVTNNGEIRLSGLAPRLTGGTVANNKLIRGDGRIDNVVTNGSAGEVRAESGKTLQFTGVNGTNAGRINLQGGTAEFSQALTNGAAGRIEGRGTLITGGAGLTNNGHVALSSGITDVFGDVTNNTGVAARGVSVSGNADVTFWDDVTHVAGSQFRVSAGSSATFFGTFAGAGISGTGDVYFEADVTPGASPAIALFGGNVNFGATSTLLMELGGMTRDSEHDAIIASGHLGLGGTLAVSLIDAGAGLLEPAAGDSFDILDWGTLSGGFSAIQLPVLGGALTWNTSQLYTTGVLSVVAPGLPGDFNLDGTVDAADYVVWRKNNNTAVTLPNDSTPGTSPADYTVWRANFGATAGSGSVSIAAANSYTTGSSNVPEPVSLMLLMIGCAAMGLLNRRRHVGDQ